MTLYLASWAILINIILFAGHYLLGTKQNGSNQPKEKVNDNLAFDTTEVKTEKKNCSDTQFVLWPVSSLETLLHRWNMTGMSGADMNIHILHAYNHICIHLVRVRWRIADKSSGETSEEWWRWGRERSNKQRCHFSFSLVFFPTGEEAYTSPLCSRHRHHLCENQAGRDSSHKTTDPLHLSLFAKNGSHSTGFFYPKPTWLPIPVPFSPVWPPSSFPLWLHLCLLGPWVWKER